MNTNTRHFKQLLTVLLIVAVTITMCFTITSNSYASDLTSPRTLQLEVDNNTPVSIRAYRASYEWNYFISLRDFAQAMNGTAKQFNVTYDKESGATDIETGKPYVAIGTEGKTDNMKEQWSSSKVADLTINGNKVKYVVYTIDDEIYIKLASLAPALDINVEYNKTKSAFVVDSTKGFTVDIKTLDKNGYFSFLHGTIVGNAKTGKVLYSNNATNKAAIASTTKIMTYLLVKEAMDKGKLSMDDTVKLSKNVEAESLSEDGTIAMKEGQEVKVEDLVKAMLVFSSNEAALALAENVSGSSEAFVKQMNAKAKSLGMTTAKYYNPHGLPTYTSDTLTAKRQNQMCAKDLFILSRYVINKYPEILDITSQKEVSVPTLNYSGTSTNRLLYNMASDGVEGLKTGSTNRAGSCLVAVMPVKVGTSTQKVIAIVMGAEDTSEQAEKTGVLLKYAKQYYTAQNAKMDNIKKVKITTKVSVKVKYAKVTFITNGYNADKYKVYRSTSKSKGYKCIKTVSAKSLKDVKVTKGKTYYYKVKGYNVANGSKYYSKTSNVVKATIK